MTVKHTAVCATLWLGLSGMAMAEQSGSVIPSDKERAHGTTKYGDEKEKLDERALRFPDGAYGFGWHYSPGRDHGPLIDSKAQAQKELSELYCKSDAIVVATLLNSAPFIDEHESIVLTAWRFRILSEIKPDASAGPGKVISLVTPGGDIEKNGRKLRVKNKYSSEFARDKEYLLFLDRANGETESVYFTYESKLEVADRKVTPVLANSWRSYASGFLLDTLGSDLTAALKNHPCK